MKKEGYDYLNNLLNKNNDLIKKMVHAKSWSYYVLIKQRLNNNKTHINFLMDKN